MLLWLFVGCFCGICRCVVCLFGLYGCLIVICMCWLLLSQCCAVVLGLGLFDCFFGLMVVCGLRGFVVFFDLICVLVSCVVVSMLVFVCCYLFG